MTLNGSNTVRVRVREGKKEVAIRGRGESADQLDRGIKGGQRGRVTLLHLASAVSR